jgi:hypothetical protein
MVCFPRNPDAYQSAAFWLVVGTRSSAGLLPVAKVDFACRLFILTRYVPRVLKRHGENFGFLRFLPKISKHVTVPAGTVLVQVLQYQQVLTLHQIRDYYLVLLNDWSRRNILCTQSYTKAPGIEHK